MSSQKFSLLKHAAVALCCMFAPMAAAAQPPEGLTWPEGQVLPHFAPPAEALDAIDVRSLTPDEQLTFSALAGHVNRRQPRIALLNRRRGERRDLWFSTPTVDLQINEPSDEGNKYDLIAKYAGEIAGAVLYAPERSPHLRNVACTAAAVQKAIPVTRELYLALHAHGVPLTVLEDLTSLELTTASKAYEYLHRTYWPRCEKRFIVSARPEGRGGDYHHTRDLAAACGAATVWLDCRDASERELFGKFLADMPAGNAVVLGWYTTERSGVTTASRFGIGTMPADHFMNATVLAGGKREIRPPQPPARPTLENKFYATMFLSDGDNIQYTQNAMRRIWDRSSNVRGRMPLNWTIAPGLVDIAPGIMNYYYTTATPNDCFVSGPSGMGYLMPVNTLDEPGAPLGCILEEKAIMDAYAQCTARYLERAGLRVVTVWDNLTSMQRRSFAKHAPGLLGMTVQNFRDDPTVQSSVENGGVQFERLVIPYAGSYEQLRDLILRQYKAWDGASPEFAAYQASVWSPLQPERLIQLMTDLTRQHPQIDFVRADHYFELQRELRERPQPEQTTDDDGPSIGPSKSFQRRG